MTDLIELLSDASTAVSNAGLKSNSVKMRKQLLACAIKLRNLAIVLRRGEMEVAAPAVDGCASELKDAIAAAKAAKNEEGYGRVLAEALEAIEAVEQHLVPRIDPAMESALMLSARTMPAGLTPIPPDLLPPSHVPWWARKPRGWPPHWPWPPRPTPPWPPEPPPWWDEIQAWGRGFPR